MKLIVYKKYYAWLLVDLLIVVAIGIQRAAMAMYAAPCQEHISFLVINT